MCQRLDLININYKYNYKVYHLNFEKRKISKY